MMIQWLQMKSVIKVQLVTFDVAFWTTFFLHDTIFINPVVYLFSFETKGQSEVDYSTSTIVDKIWGSLLA